MRVKTGIPNMDCLIGGGIPSGSTVLVSGGCGTGKTTFSIHYIGNGVDDYGDLGVFATFVDDVDKVLLMGKNFGYPLEGWNEAGVLKIIGGAPGRLQGFSGEADVRGEDLTDEMLDAVEDVGADRFVMDGLARFEDLFETRRDFVTNLCRLSRELRELDCTSVLTCSRDVEVEELADGVIVLHYAGKVQKERFIEVVKMFTSLHTDRLERFEITGDGFVLTEDSGESKSSENLKKMSATADRGGSGHNFRKYLEIN